ncbi:hypothetical protein AMTR_s00025p00241940 [Amborella trichopoda]|uniref:Uncharacterized protein n=1 Tax=Amborella trichopoda TaxID=13333 RepID=W1PXP4_AMBTC|nr:hypothetical protein AMTR_s00025p00241940 [Amborella trichopoda]
MAKAVPPSYFLDVGSKLSVAPKVCKTSSFFLFLVLVVASQRHLSSLTFIVLLSLHGSMYPLYHHNGARRICFTSRPPFDPLMVDPLVIVIVEENPEPQLLEEDVDKTVLDARNLIAVHDSILENNL